jgi:hypothetical protein
MLGPDIPEWIVAEYYAYGPQPYLKRLMHVFTDISRKKYAHRELSKIETTQ